jgi:hypothetical protein
MKQFSKKTTLFALWSFVALFWSFVALLIHYFIELCRQKKTGKRNEDRIFYYLLYYCYVPAREMTEETVTLTGKSMRRLY